MKLTRILSLLLALLTVASLLCACKPEEETPDDPVEDPATTTSLSLIVNGETDYVLVRDYQADESIISAVQALATSIQNNIGDNFHIMD